MTKNRERTQLLRKREKVQKPGIFHLLKGIEFSGKQTWKQTSEATKAREEPVNLNAWQNKKADLLSPVFYLIWGNSSGVSTMDWWLMLEKKWVLTEDFYSYCCTVLKKEKCFWQLKLKSMCLRHFVLSSFYFVHHEGNTKLEGLRRFISKDEAKVNAKILWYLSVFQNT